MFAKLARRNVSRCVRDYGIYFLTLTFGVCLFYVFNCLENQSVMGYLNAKGGSWAVEGIMRLMRVFSVFVSAVLAGLILYANQFLIRRRKRELGTYYLLGMGAGAVSRLLVGETLLIALAALAAGLPLGVLASWVFDKFTIGMFLEDTSALFRFSVSLKGAGKTVLYFGIIFLLVMVFTWLSVSRSKLIDLVRGERKNEEMTQRPAGVTAALFLAGCACLGAAYAMCLILGLFQFGPSFWIMLALGSVGTFLVFRSLSGFLLRLTRGHSGYFKGLNMFVLRQWTGRIHTGSVSNTVICLLLLLAIGITACSVGLNQTMNALLEDDSPYDCTILNYGRDTAYERADLAALFRQAGVDPQDSFSRLESVTVYYNDESVTGIIQPTIYAVIDLSSYNRIVEGRGLAGLSEQEAEGGIDTPYAVVNGPAANGLMVVPDRCLSGLTPRRQMVNIDYAGDKDAVDEAVRSAVAAMGPESGLDLEGNYRLDNYYDLMGNKLLVLYLGLYLGFVFLLAAAAVLALQQLSQASDNVKRFRLLQQLGAPEEMRRGALFQQIALAFVLPLALAVLHAAVGMTAANQIIAQVGKVDVARSSAVTALFLLLLYGGYFLATCLGAWNTVKSAGRRRDA